jgi:N6-L-threonylcarbamoyladenine synthase
MIVMGIETSCDETSVAIIEQKKTDGFGYVLAENTLSQVNKHNKFGGIVPELASREHEKTLNFLVKKTLSEANINLKKIDAFAATTGPGLLGGLLIGSNYAKTLSLANNKPFLSVNHLQGHILITRMNQKIRFPFLSLLLSGGHTQLLVVKAYNKFEIIGETLDDALGEAFDKTAKLLGYGYPGGPIIEKLALKEKSKNFFKLPKPLLNSKNLDFSFSGLKTSIRKIAEKPLNKSLKCKLANEFQECITEILLTKCEKAINLTKKEMDISSFVLAGGVASNKFIREKFNLLCDKHSIEFIVPKKNLCVDNATMIAWAGIERLKKKKSSDPVNEHPKPRWSVENL